MGTMVLQNTGHVAIAQSIYANTMYLAWGDLPPLLGAPTGLTASALNTGGSLGTGSLRYAITAYTPGGETTISTPVTINITGTGGIVTLSWAPLTGATGYNIYGRTTDGYYYIGSTTNTTFVDNGSITPTVTITPPTTDQSSVAAWQATVPSPGTTFTGLYREVGRRLIQRVQYVYPDPNGVYVTTAGRWSVSSVATRFIYCYVAFDLNDAVTSTIYQFGIFMNTIPATGYTNSAYLLPSQISNPGTLLNLINVPPIIRNASSSETYQVVLTF